MNIVDLAKFLALMNKIKIENDPTLSKEEKELWKHIMDEIEKQVEKENQRKTF